MSTIEVRCPSSVGKLFMKLKLSGEPVIVTEGNLLEFSCSDCKRLLKKEGTPVFRVLHRYDLAGALIETEIVPD